MATTQRIAKTNTSDVAIFGRLLSNAKGEMSPDLARYVLTLGFGDADQARMRELAARNQEGGLSPGEHDELLGYVKAGHLLALLHSQARKALKKRKGS
jgi:hypothetical protein